MLRELGTLTIFHLASARSGPEHNRLAWEWAADVWKAHSPLHGLARYWIENIL